MAPSVHLDVVRQIYNDGNHNAFTDLCRFQGRYWLAFRSCPDGHLIFTSSRILIMASEDGKTWESVYSFSIPGRDVRDPYFLVFKDRLFVYIGAWLVYDDPRHADMNTHQGYCVWSKDGTDWQGPIELEATHGYFIGRVASDGHTAYLNGRRLKDFAPVPEGEEEEEKWQSWLLKSDDGFNWGPAGVIQPQYGDETALLFEEDGTALAVARTAKRRRAQVCRSRSPYQEWVCKDLSRHIGGPMLKKWGDHYLVGGRKTKETGPVMALSWLVDDELEEVLELPSGGDTSYSGFVALSPQRGLLSYYSSHEGSGTSLAPSAIYLAELRQG